MRVVVFSIFFALCAFALRESPRAWAGPRKVMDLQLLQMKTALREPDPAVRIRALQEIAKLDLPYAAADTFIAPFNLKEPIPIRYDDVLVAVVMRLRDVNPDVRAAAVQTLSTVEVNPGIVSMVGQYATSGTSAELRISAVRALAQINCLEPSNRGWALFKAANLGGRSDYEQDPRVREEANQALSITPKFCGAKLGG